MTNDGIQIQVGSGARGDALCEQAGGSLPIRGSLAPAAGSGGGGQRRDHDTDPRGVKQKSFGIGLHAGGVQCGELYEREAPVALPAPSEGRSAIAL